MQHYWDQEDRKNKAKKRDEHERNKRIKQGKINHRDPKDREEVKRLLHESYARAQKCLQTNHKELENLAKGLLQYETLSGEEVVKVMKGYKIDPKKRSQKPSRQLKPIRKPSRSSSNIPASLSSDRQDKQDRPPTSKQSM